MKNRTAELVARAAIVAMFALAFAAWPSAPAQIPIHWNIAGQINGYGPKVVGLFILPLLALAGYALIGLAPTLKPEQFNGRLRSALSWFRFAYVLLMAGVFGVVVADARGSNVNMNYVVFPLVALMWIAIANLLVRSGQAKIAKTTPPGGGIRI
jgi:immunity protein, SdpI family